MTEIKKTLGDMDGEVVYTLEATKELVTELLPQIKKLTEELNPALTELRKNLDRDETLMLVNKLSENIDTFLKFVNILEATKELTDQALPNIKMLVEELTPRLNTIRVLIDDDDTWEIIEHLLSLKRPIIKYMDALLRIEEVGYRDMTLLDTTLDFLVKFSVISNQPSFQQFWEGVVNAIHLMNDAEIKKVSTLGLFAALRDEDVQKAIGSIMVFLKSLGKSIP
ncbi:hypothetical protein DRP07_02895 [Archaeoglobales archaeon]|nr:MAG: hypothetical protein DRP07_02895 [Archaeoglobales archaeon]